MALACLPHKTRDEYGRCLPTPRPTTPLYVFARACPGPRTFRVHCYPICYPTAWDEPGLKRMENVAASVFDNRFSTFRPSSGLTGMLAIELGNRCSIRLSYGTVLWFHSLACRSGFWLPINGSAPEPRRANSLYHSTVRPPSMIGPRSPSSLSATLPSQCIAAAAACVPPNAAQSIFRRLSRS